MCPAAICVRSSAAGEGRLRVVRHSSSCLVEFILCGDVMNLYLC